MERQKGRVRHMKQPRRKSLQQSEGESITAFAIATQAGLGIVLPLVAGGLIGWYLDGHLLHSAIPLATLVGLLIGLLVGAYGLIRLISLLR
jgi:F0F1-type ATP synthase assembly protein I